MTYRYYCCGSLFIFYVFRLSYVRTIEGHESGVQVVAVSETLGDIASVSHHGKLSINYNLYLSNNRVNYECVAVICIFMSKIHYPSFNPFPHTTNQQQIFENIVTIT